jgi:hypothetical protein
MIISRGKKQQKEKADVKLERVSGGPVKELSGDVSRFAHHSMLSPFHLSYFVLTMVLNRMLNT